MNVEKIILWTRQIGWPPSYKKCAEKKWMDLIHHALTLGIRAFDTAPIYGNGQSEILLWKALQKSPVNRKNISLITKFGMRLWKGGNNYFCFSEESIKQELQESLTRLQTNYIDVYLLHIPDEKQIDVDEVIQVLNTLKSEWQIKSYGLCNTYGWLLENFLHHPDSHIEYIEDFYNILERKAEKLIFPYLDEQKFFAYSPLYRWFLTDIHPKILLQKDEAGINRLLKHNGIKDLLIRRQILKNTAASQWISLQGLALNFLKNNSHVDKILFGTTSKEHLDEFVWYFLKK